MLLAVAEQTFTNKYEKNQFSPIFIFTLQIDQASVLLGNFFK